jgi:hypothetical protein
VEWADTLVGALELVFGAPDDGDDGGDDGDGGDPAPVGTIEELLAEAEDAFANADTALRSGDLAGYQEWVDEAERVLDELADILSEPEPNATAPGPM